MGQQPAVAALALIRYSAMFSLQSGATFDLRRCVGLCEGALAEQPAEAAQRITSEGAATHIELVRFVAQIEAKAQALTSVTLLHRERVLDDHRTEAIGELSGVLDAIEQGLGRRLIAALYPEHRRLQQPVEQLNLGETEAAAEVL